MIRPRAQRGFTIIELLVAATIAMILFLPAMALLLQSEEFAANQEARLRINGQARQVMQVLGNGAPTTGAAGTDGSLDVYGLRGRQSLPLGGLRQEGRFTLGGNGLTVLGDGTTGVAVTCTGPGAPIPDCTTAGAVVTPKGWLGEDVGFEADLRSVADRTVETGLSVTDPYDAARTPRRPADVTERYRGIFTLNREMPDP